MSNEKLVPVEYCQYLSERVRFNLNLPSWVDTDHIGVNLKYIHFLMSLGGVSTLQVKGESGNQERQPPTIVGVNHNGEAEAAKLSAAKRADLFNTTSNQEDELSFLQNFNWTHAKVGIYTNEAADRISSENKSLKKSESWVPHLDEVVRSSLRRIGTRHLLKDLGPMQKFGALLTVADGIILDSMNISLGSMIFNHFGYTPLTLESLFYNMGSSALYWMILSRALFGAPLEKDGKGYRVSLFPGYEMDRAALLNILTVSLPVIKFIDNKPPKP